MIFLTGGTGIVGTRLLFDLLKKGEEVRALKRPGSDLSFVSRVFSFYDPSQGRSMLKGVEWVEGDILDPIGLEAAMRGSRTVFHAAGLVSYSPADRQRLMDINVGGTANAVNIATAVGVEKFCHISSVAALGSRENGEAVDESTPRQTTDRRSVYGASKFAAEREVWRAAAEGLPMVIVNPSIVLGPARENQSSGMLFTMLRRGVPFYPRGVTGLVDVRDVSRMAIGLTFGDALNQRFILNSENLGQRELLDMAADIFDRRKPRFAAAPWALEFAWRASAFQSAFTGRKPKITAETARSASRVNRYDAGEVRRELDTSFIPVREALRYYRPFDPSHG